MAGPASRDISTAKFRTGMDCSQGVMGDSLEAFRELTNVLVSEDNNLELRMPCLKLSGGLSPLAQGLVQNGGAYFTIARRGDVIVHTGAVAALVSTLYFDPPENVRATWTLVAMELFQNHVVAYIRHGFPGTTITSRLYEHTWDLKVDQPTYVSDPSAPWDWGPAGFPVNAYGNGTGDSGQWTDFTPFIEPAAEKIWVNRVDRNVGFPGIGRERVWNSLSAASIEKLGTMYYFTVPAGGGIQTFAIPEAFADFADYQKFAGYVLESLNANGTWSKITEAIGAPAAGQWQLVTGTRAWCSFPVAVIRAIGLAADLLIRIRILVTPEVEIVSGGVLTPGSEAYRGDGSTIQWPSLVPYAAFAGSYSVRVNGNVKAQASYYTVTNNNGLARVDFFSFSQVTDGKLTAGVLVPGTGYTSFPAIALVGGSGGSGAAAVVTSLKAVSAVVAAGGAGYTLNDILTLTTDTGTQATFQATGVAAGVVTAVTLVTGGILTAVAVNPHATAGGTGAGCTLTVQYGVGSVTVTPGQGYVTAPTTNITGGAGAGATLSLVLAAPVGNTAIPYTSATDGDFGRLKVYFNGLLQTETTNYTIANNGGFAFVTPTTGLALGTTLDARLIVPLDTLLEFISPSLVLQVANITYEQNAQTTLPVLLTSLAPSSTYYVAVAANGVTNFKLTSAAWTGLERYQIRIIGTVTTDGAGNILSTAPFQYGGEALTQWYNLRHQANLDYWAGENEAAFINSGTHDNSGGNVTSMVAVKNRLAIFYQEGTQLWQVDPIPTNCAFIDRYAFGTRYQGINFYNRPLIYTQKGFRAFDLQGLNFQSLEDINIGQTIQPLGDFTVYAATFWPWRGSYIAYVRLDNADRYAEMAGLPLDSVFRQSSIYGFIYLTFSKEQEIRAWSFHQVAGLANVTKLIADDARVYALSGSDIWYFDDLATVYRDGEGADVPYTGDANWHLMPLGKASASVRMLHCDLVKTGRARMKFAVMPWNASREVAGPETAGTTVGAQRVPLRCTGRAVAARLLTNDASGLSLQSIRYEFMPLGR